MKKIFLILFFPALLFSFSSSASADLLNAPENLTINKSGCITQWKDSGIIGYALLSWVSIENATSYRVYVRSSTASQFYKPYEEVLGNAYRVIFGLESKFYISVSSVNITKNMESNKSKEVYITGENLFALCGSITPLPTPPSPSGAIEIKVVGANYTGGSKRNITISWNSINASDEIVKYNIYTKRDDSTYWKGPTVTFSNAEILDLYSSYDYFVRVEGCGPSGQCVSSQELFILKVSVTPSEEQQEAKKEPATIAEGIRQTMETFLFETPQAAPTPTPLLTANEKKTQKEAIPFQEQSKKAPQRIEQGKQEKQGVLQEGINILLRFFKSLFRG